MRSAITPLILLIFFSACDTVKEPIPPATTGPVGPIDPIDSTDTVVRRVLLEDFTGHRCSNCPQATSIALQLQELYGEALIVVGIHVTDIYAAPVSPSPDGSYTTDFRTPAGNEYEQSFGISWLPVGMVSRKSFSNGKLVDRDDWGASVEEVTALPAAMDIWFSTLEYDEGSNLVDAEVKVAILEPLTGTYNLTIYLVEDHVTDWQYNGQATPPNVPDYDHRHVLRTNVNGTWGASLIDGSAAVGDTITLTYNDFPLQPGWNGNNCSLVAYAYDTGTDEVMQAVEQKFGR